MSGAIRSLAGPQGEVLHLVPFSASALPGVAKRDLEQAWEAARASAQAAASGPAHGFRFAQTSGPPVDLILADPDAASWTRGIDQIVDLSTARGISICLRLLALVALMARADWLRPWFALKPGGAEIHPALLQAAALAPLTRSGDFAESSLRALLPAGN